MLRVGVGAGREEEGGVLCEDMGTMHRLICYHWRNTGRLVEIWHLKGTWLTRGNGVPYEAPMVTPLAHSSECVVMATRCWHSAIALWTLWWRWHSGKHRASVSELVNQSRTFPVPLCRKIKDPVLTISHSLCLISSSAKGIQTVILQLKLIITKRKRIIATKFHRLLLPFYVPGFFNFQSDLC